MATDLKKEKEKLRAAAKASPSVSAAKQAARSWVHRPLREAIPQAAKAVMGVIEKVGGGALAPYQTPTSSINGYRTIGPGKITEGTRAQSVFIPSAGITATRGNVPSPRTTNKPGSGDTRTPLGTTDPTGQRDSIASQTAAQPKQTSNRYLEMAKYGNLLNAMTQPVTEDTKKRFFDMGGIQTIRGTMKPDERPSVGWWNPNTLREHATIQEGMMGQDLGTTMARYQLDAPIAGGIEKEKIKAGADVATAEIQANKPIVVTNELTGEPEVLDPRKAGQGPDPAKVIESMAAANSVEEARAILEGQPPAVRAQVQRLWKIVRSLGEG